MPIPERLPEDVATELETPQGESIEQFIAKKAQQSLAEIGTTEVPAEKDQKDLFMRRALRGLSHEAIATETLQITEELLGEYRRVTSLNTQGKANLRELFEILDPQNKAPQRTRARELMGNLYPPKETPVATNTATGLERAAREITLSEDGSEIFAGYVQSLIAQTLVAKGAVEIPSQVETLIKNAAEDRAKRGYLIPEDPERAAVHREICLIEGLTEVMENDNVLSPKGKLIRKLNTQTHNAANLPELFPQTHQEYTHAQTQQEFAGAYATYVREASEYRRRAEAYREAKTNLEGEPGLATAQKMLREFSPELQTTRVDLATLREQILETEKLLLLEAVTKGPSIEKRIGIVQKNVESLEALRGFTGLMMEQETECTQIEGRVRRRAVEKALGPGSFYNRTQSTTRLQLYFSELNVGAQYDMERTHTNDQPEALKNAYRYLMYRIPADFDRAIVSEKTIMATVKQKVAKEGSFELLAQKSLDNVGATSVPKMIPLLARTLTEGGVSVEQATQTIEEILSKHYLEEKPHPVIVQALELEACLEDMAAKTGKALSGDLALMDDTLDMDFLQRQVDTAIEGLSLALENAVLDRAQESTERIERLEEAKEILTGKM